jgi:hypothetical protein
VQRFKDNVISGGYRLYLIKTTFLRLGALMVSTVKQPGGALRGTPCTHSAMASV